MSMSAESKEKLSNRFPGFPGAKILVVDDDESIIDAIETALESRNYTVLSAPSGEEALEVFREEDIDIAFLDIKMPGMNGIEVLRKLKEENHQVHVIMMTAYASVDSAVEAMREGAEDYIRKPFDVKDIKSTILGAIEDLEFEEKSRTYATPPELEWEDPVEAFESWVERGRSGLVVSAGGTESTLGGDSFQEKGELLVLTEDPDEEFQIHPEELNQLRERVVKFASENEESVILLNDLDYLVNRNRLDSLKGFIQKLENDLFPLDSVLMFSGSPQTMRNEEVEELEYLVSDMPASVVSDSLSNQIRRRVISQLSEKEGISFTTLAREAGIDDSPKMSFHLKKLESRGVIEKNGEGRYSLTEIGESAEKILQEIREGRTEREGKTVWMLE